MKTPTHLGREYRPFDIFGWLICLGWFFILYKVLNTNFVWWEYLLWVGVCGIMLWEAGTRIIMGRLYLIVYHDTILRTMYEVSHSGKTYFVCSENEDELALYMDSYYPDVKYNIVDKHTVESYLKREEYQ